MKFLATSGRLIGYTYRRALTPFGISLLSVTTLILFLSGEVFPAQGDLDGTFGLGGKVITAFGSSHDAAYAVVVQPDGKTIVAGETVEGSNRFFALVRYNRDGSLDNSFDGDGKVTTLIPFGSKNIARAIVVQTDGKIVVAGTTENNNGGGSLRNFVVVRYNVNGNLDTSFDNDGIAVTQIAGPGEDAYDAVIQSDGKIVVVGYSGSSLGILRYNTNGSLDTTFDSDGKATVSIPNGYIVGRAVRAQSDGKLVVAGYAFRGLNDDFALVRFNLNGSLDTTFGTNGFVFTAIGNASDVARALAITPEGKIVVGGTANDSVSGILALAQYDTNGSLDTSFGTNGVVTTPGGIYSLQDLQIQINRKIVVVGSRSSGPGSDVLVVRYHSDGSLDASFGINGIVITTFPIGASNRSADAYGAAVQRDGRIVVTGTAYNGSDLDIFVTRYIAGRVSFDYDGDGRADLSIRRPSNNIWHLLRATAGYTAMEYGVAGDRMTPADYDGDGKTDVAVFRPSNGLWFIHMSQSQTFQVFGWGENGDLPLPADRDGDGKTDFVIFRPSNNIWYTRFANNTFGQTQFGEAGDKPVAGDFDADGIGDIAVYRPSNHNWYILRSSLGFFIQTWGEPGDRPLTGDFDGDGLTDRAVYRPSTGQWYLSQTTAGFSVRNWGESTDIPVMADYDGDAKTDVGVFRPSNGTWYIVESTAGISIQQFGQNGDVPTQSAYNY